MQLLNCKEIPALLKSNVEIPSSFPENAKNIFPIISFQRINVFTLPALLIYLVTLCPPTPGSLLIKSESWSQDQCVIFILNVDYVKMKESFLFFLPLQQRKLDSSELQETIAKFSSHFDQRPKSSKEKSLSFQLSVSLLRFLP